MNRILLDQAETIFHAVADLPAAERGRQLTALCGSDSRLRTLVESLIQSDDSGSGGFLADPFQRQRAVPLPDPDQIGRYRIIRKIGEGGMAVVYEARQQNPTRNVALKMLRSPLPSADMVRRFEYEAEVLARLNHPGVAHIYEAGTTTMEQAGLRGLPYFAMELVNGRSMVQFARKQNLDTPSRLELIAQVCDAVHYAHQRGVIHRDLKPANILVDEAGRPKVLDFGVARALASNGVGITRHTHTHALLGTLAYMSPEQAAGDIRNLDVRSDVYALGVCLFELLSGRLPHDCAGCSVQEAVRRICEDEPARISDASAAFRGEIETIVAKCLQKDAALRYSSAAELAADIRRYLHGDPIEAKRHSRIYMLRKTLRRYRWPVAMAGLVTIALATFAAYAFIQAARHRTLAEAAQRASQQAITTQRILQQMLEAADPQHSGGQDVTVKQILDDAAANLEAGELADQPVVEAEIRSTIARTYFNLGRYMTSVPHFEWLRDYIEREIGEPSREMVEALCALGQAQFRAGGDGLRADGRATFERALSLADEYHGHDKKLRLTAMIGLADALWRVGSFDDAESLASEARESVRETLGEEHELFAASSFQLGNAQSRAGRTEEAEPVLLEALALTEELYGPASQTALYIRQRIARDIYRPAKRYEESLELLTPALSLARRALGPDHRQTVGFMAEKSDMLRATDRVDEAEAFLREALAGVRQIRAVEESDTIKIAARLADLLRDDRGSPEEAAQVYVDAVEQARQAHGSRHRGFANSLWRCADFIAGAGEFAEAEQFAREALQIRERLPSPPHKLIAASAHQLAYYVRCAGRYSEAIPLYRRDVELCEAFYGPSHRETIRATVGLVSCLLRMGSCDEAIRIISDRYSVTREARGPTVYETRLGAVYLRQALSRCSHHQEAKSLCHEMLSAAQEKYGTPSNRAGDWWMYLGRALADSGDPVGAVDAFKESIASYHAVEARAKGDALRDLSDVLVETGTPVEAERAAEEALGLLRKTKGEQHSDTFFARLTLGRAIMEAGRPEEALPLLHEALDAISATPLPAEHLDVLVGWGEAMLGRCLMLVGTYAEAETLSLSALEKLRVAHGEGHIRSRAAMGNLVKLYDAWGRSWEAITWQAQLDALPSLPGASPGM